MQESNASSRSWMSFDAEERESRKRKIKWLVIIAAVICVVIAIGMHYKRKAEKKLPTYIILKTAAPSTITECGRR